MRLPVAATGDIVFAEQIRLGQPGSGGIGVAKLRNLGRYTDGAMASRHVAQHHCVGTDDSAVAYQDRPQQFRARANSHPCAKDRLATTRSVVADRDTLEQDSVRPDDHSATDDDSGGMGQVQPWCDRCPRMHLGPAAS